MGGLLVFFSFFFSLLLEVAVANECIVTHLLNSGFERKVVSTNPEDWKNVEAMQKPQDVKWQTTSLEGEIKVVKYGYHDFTPSEGIQAASLSSGGAIFQDVVSVPGTRMFWKLNAMVKEKTEKATLTVGIGSPDSVQTKQSITANDTQFGGGTGTYDVPAGQTVTRLLLTPVSGESLVDAVVFGTKECVVGIVELSGSETFVVGSEVYLYVSLLTDASAYVDTLSLTGTLPGHMSCSSHQTIKYWRHQAHPTPSVTPGWYPIGSCVGNNNVTVKIDPLKLWEYVLRIPVKINEATPKPHGFVLEWYGHGDDIKSTAPLLALPRLHDDTSNVKYDLRRIRGKK